MAVAHLGLSVSEFYEMRIGNFYNALNAWTNHQMSQQRFIAELMRMQTTDLINIQLKKKDRLKPKQLWVFDWDNKDTEEGERPTTAEEIRQYNAEIMKRFNENGE